MKQQQIVKFTIPALSAAEIVSWKSEKSGISLEKCIRIHPQLLEPEVTLTCPNNESCLSPSFPLFLPFFPCSCPYFFELYKLLNISFLSVTAKSWDLRKNRCGLLRNSPLSGNPDKVHRQNHSTKLVSTTPEGVSCSTRTEFSHFLVFMMCFFGTPTLPSNFPEFQHITWSPSGSPFPSFSQSSLSFTFLVYLFKILFLYCAPTPFLFN